MLKSKKGFTLVELVVVIIILGILIMFLAVGIRMATDKSKEKVCNGNMRNMNSIATYYLGTCSIMGKNPDATIDADELANPNNLIGASLYTDTPTCPSQGTYLITLRPAVDVECSYHTDDP